MKAKSVVMRQMPHVIRRTWIVFFVGLIAAAGALDSHAAEEQPNILFILTDDIGWPNLACYGHPFPSSRPLRHWPKGLPSCDAVI